MGVNFVRLKVCVEIHQTAKKYIIQGFSYFLYVWYNFQYDASQCQVLFIFLIIIFFYKRD